MYAIVSYFTTIYGQQHEATLEYADSEAYGLQRMRNWAAYHGALDRLSPDGLYFDKENGTTFRLEYAGEQEQS